MRIVLSLLVLALLPACAPRFKQHLQVPEDQRIAAVQLAREDIGLVGGDQRTIGHQAALSNLKDLL